MNTASLKQKSPEDRDSGGQSKKLSRDSYTGFDPHFLLCKIKNMKDTKFELFFGYNIIINVGQKVEWDIKCLILIIRIIKYCNIYIYIPLIQDY